MHQSARDAVLVELRALRRNSAGATAQTLASASVICRLLGAGDPYLAYTRLQHALLDATLDRPLRAASSSLGFASAGSTLLARLDEAGGDLGLDQRQVRRLSDRGLETLATLITTNWTVEAVPDLTAVITSAPSRFVIAIAAARPLVIEMSEPDVLVLAGESRSVPELVWRWTETEGRARGAIVEPIVVSPGAVETSVAITWRGELWPKFAVYWLGQTSETGSESLGNKLMLRLTRALT